MKKIKPGREPEGSLYPNQPPVFPESFTDFDANQHVTSADSDSYQGTTSVVPNSVR
jgi:hypothetical protein